MDPEITLTLPTSFVGQVLDLLEDQRDLWEYTERYLTNGETEDDRIIADCSYPEDARKMVDYYDDIIALITKQRSA